MSQFRPVEDGIFIGPQPTPDDLEDARQRAIKTVIDFRLPSETATSNETLTVNGGLDYINIPVTKRCFLKNRLTSWMRRCRRSKAHFCLTAPLARARRCCSH